MKAIRLMAVLIVVGLAATAQATPTVSTGGDGLQLEVFVTDLGGGQWEYQYDLSAREARGYQWYTPFDMRFDFNDSNASTVEDNFLNLYDNPASGRKELHEYWAANGVTGNNNGEGGGWWGPLNGRDVGFQPSYGDLATDTWIILPTVPQADAEDWIVDPTYAMAEGFANPFHLPSDYAICQYTNPLANTSPETATDYDMCFAIQAGVPEDRDGDGNADDLNLGWGGSPQAGPYPGPGFIYGGDAETWNLVATIRIVSDLGPYGTVQLIHYTGGTKTTGLIVAPGVPEPATMSLLALGGLAVLVRRRRK